MIWNVPISWSMFSVVSIEANSLKEAFKIANDMPVPERLPMDMEYVDGSWGAHFRDDEIEEVRHLYNEDKQDERGV